MQVGKVNLTIEGEKEDSIVTAYLFSLDDREFTITFITPESRYRTNENEIDKIIRSFKFSLN